jgi:hypothetical protein
MQSSCRQRVGQLVACPPSSFGTFHPRRSVNMCAASWYARHGRWGCAGADHPSLSHSPVRHKLQPSLRKAKCPGTPPHTLRHRIASEAPCANFRKCAKPPTERQFKSCSIASLLSRPTKLPLNCRAHHNAAMGCQLTGQRRTTAQVPVVQHAHPAPWEARAEQ